MNTKKELKDRNIKPIKHRGQNFLVSQEIIKKIIDSARIKAGEVILEVGPGTGNLTKALLESGAEVTAVEKDENLFQLLKLKSPHFAKAPRGRQNSPLRPQGFAGQANLKIIEGDILKFDETQIKPPYRVIANIPYYLTGALIQKFLLSPNKPTELILMTQKEVGERITARPPRANYLSSLVQFLASAEVLFPVKKENFWPQPQVDSVMIKLIPHHRIPSLLQQARYTV
ncbi:MAG: 16S rRNA (adenine(1518)-N(6)/adenine(1519)-N(6))-dimethyltransferase RsmA, partial [Minisyncoccia bacterium]